jgi:hypothetical protein
MKRMRGRGGRRGGRRGTRDEERKKNKKAELPIYMSDLCTLLIYSRKIKERHSFFKHNLNYIK